VQSCLLRVILEIIVSVVFITNGFNCFICSVNKCCYLLNPGPISYNTYLRIFYLSFVKKKIKFKQNYNPCITKGIKILYNKTKSSYLKCGESNDTNSKLYYK
jgi:hypothetical protein